MNPAYTSLRPQILELVPTSAASVLDVGCSIGILAKSLKTRNRSCEVWGIEVDCGMAEEAGQHLDRLFVADVDQFDWDRCIGEHRFDCILFADVLEHLRDPWHVLTESARRLSPGGIVVLSIPNIRHLSSFYWIFVRGRWPYRKSGRHDETHLRFFTLANIRDLCHAANLAISNVSRIYEFPLIEGGWLARRMRQSRILGAIPVLREFFTRQYFVKAEMRSHHVPVPALD